MQLGAVLVDRGEQRRIGGDAGDAALHVRLVDGELRGIHRLRQNHALLRRLLPRPHVHRLAFPQRRVAQPRQCGSVGEDAVDVAADTSAGDGETELAAVRTLALAGVEIEAGGAQPCCC
jgi:hypothetical protein